MLPIEGAAAPLLTVAAEASIAAGPLLPGAEGFMAAARFMVGARFMQGGGQFMAVAIMPPATVHPAIAQAAITVAAQFMGVEE